MRPERPQCVGAFLAVSVNQMGLGAPALGGAPSGGRRGETSPNSAGVAQNTPCLFPRHRLEN